MLHSAILFWSIMVVVGTNVIVVHTAWASIVFHHCVYLTGGLFGQYQCSLFTGLKQEVLQWTDHLPVFESNAQSDLHRLIICTIIYVTLRSSHHRRHRHPWRAAIQLSSGQRETVQDESSPHDPCYSWPWCCNGEFAAHLITSIIFAIHICSVYDTSLVIWKLSTTIVWPL